MGGATVGLLLVRFLHLGPYQLVFVVASGCEPPEVNVSSGIQTYEVKETPLRVHEWLYLLQIVHGYLRFSAVLLRPPQLGSLQAESAKLRSGQSLWRGTYRPGWLTSEHTRRSSGAASWSLFGSWVNLKSDALDPAGFCVILEPCQNA